MNKRIAFITENFMGSILPLARQLCQRQYRVDIYMYRREIHEPEACELDFKAEHYGINAIPPQHYTGITEYIGNDNLKLFTFSQIKPYSSVPVLRNLIGVVMRFQAYKAAGVISSQDYDIINVIGNYNMPHMKDLLHYLKGNVVLSLHEVWNHSNPSPVPYVLVKEAIDKKCRINVFSMKSLDDIHNIDGIDMSKVSRIPFGLFESYAHLKMQNFEVALPEKYFLFFGQMVPYKGLGVLYQAVKILGDDLKDFKVVIAGKGNDPVLHLASQEDRCITITRFIRNAELSTLMGNAYAAICPYLTMSQSGIPQTAFPFGTPIIASDLGGFREIITPDNGMLFKVGDPQALADCMRKLIQHPEERERLNGNIRRFVQLNPQYDWGNICDDFTKLI